MTKREQFVLAENICALLRMNGLTQIELAYMVSTARSMITFIMQAKRVPSEALLNKIAIALGVYPSDLLNEYMFSDEWRKRDKNGDLIKKEVRKIEEVQAEDFQFKDFPKMKIKITKKLHKDDIQALS